MILAKSDRTSQNLKNSDRTSQNLKNAIAIGKKLIPSPIDWI
jgi:hypothetical protein